MAVENLKKHSISALLILIFSFWLYIAPNKTKKKISLGGPGCCWCFVAVLTEGKYWTDQSEQAKFYYGLMVGRRSQLQAGRQAGRLLLLLPPIFSPSYCTIIARQQRLTDLSLLLICHPSASAFSFFTGEISRQKTKIKKN